jgi:ribosomal protein S1
MPSPENALPAEGTALIDTLASPVSPPAAKTAESLPESARADAPAADASPSPADTGSLASAHGSDVSPSPNGTTPTGPRKRRRRRRRKGAVQPPANASGGAPGTSVAPEGEALASGDAAGEADEKAPAPPVQPTTQTGAPREGKAKRRGQRRERTDKPREKRESRERPVFGIGDVVFGKILEITDDAILVDLSGKAKGIFDRAEMLLPDDPAEAPDTQDKKEPESSVSDVANAHADASAEGPALEVATSNEAIEDATPAPDPDPAAPASLPAASAEAEVEVPPTVTSGGLERKSSTRRIIVAAAALAIDAQAQEAAPLPSPDKAPDADVEGAPEGEGESTALAPSMAPEVVVEAPAPKPAPYAPPIVLEVGAHFVGLVHNDGSRGGLIVLTRHPRRVSQTKPTVHTAFKERKPIRGLVTGVVKGGVEVDVDGLRAFAPGSHMDLRLGTDLHHLIAKRLDFLVTQYGKRGRDIVLSRKPMLEDEAKAHRGAALAKLVVGSVVEGIVKSVVSFGAFIDVGGVEGLVALPEMSHNRADTPADVFKAGETIQVKILRIDDKGKVWLSRKATSADPRQEAVRKYAVGTKHTAKVVRLQPFGAFLELEPGIDGLIHTQDLSIKRIEHPSEVVKVDDSMEVVVASIDPVAQKISLHPALTGAAADETPQRVQIHKPVKVVVALVESGGLVVRVLGATGRNARGFITSAATGTPRGTELRKPFPVGSQLEAKVIEIDPRRGELKLSIKALHDETERTAYQQYRQQVTREAKFGTFGDLLAKKGLTNK